MALRQGDRRPCALPSASVICRRNAALSAASFGRGMASLGTFAGRPVTECATVMSQNTLPRWEVVTCNQLTMSPLKEVDTTADDFDRRK